MRFLNAEAEYLCYCYDWEEKNMYFENLWKAFAQLEEVEAIALGGSRAGSNYDEKSDYDLYIYCTEIPDEKVRAHILEQCCQYVEMGNHFWELEDDCTLKDGVDIDILYRNLDSFTEEVASVVEKHIAHNGYTTCMWHNVLHSKILYDGKGKFSAMQKRFDVAYPDELQKNIIGQNMRLLTGNLPSYDSQIKKALKREDLVSVNHRTAAFLESYCDIIFALNKLTHPGEKRMVQYAQGHAQKLPAHFEENINSLLKSLYVMPDAVPDILQNIISELQKSVSSQSQVSTEVKTLQ